MHKPPHPGEILKELYLKPLGLNVTQTAKGLRITRKSLSALLNRRAGISTDMALRLGRAFHTAPESWLAMQQQCDLWHAQTQRDFSGVKTFVSEPLAA